jgi:hypothetical protein
VLGVGRNGAKVLDGAEFDTTWRIVAWCLPDVKQNRSSTRLVLREKGKIRKTGQMDGSKEPATTEAAPALGG